MWVGIGVGIGRNRFATGIFNAYALRVTADGGITEAGQCVDAVSGLLLNASLLLIPSGYKGGRLYSQIPTNGNGDLTWTRGSDANRTNSSGNIELMATGVPRLSYMYGSCPSVLLEPQRTNSLRNSSMIAASTSPSTIPTNWLITLGGVTATVVGVGTENGLPYIDIRFNGTATATSVNVNFESTTQITASNGQSWTSSFWIKEVSASFPPISYRNAITERDSGGATLAGSNQTIAISSTLNRNAFTRTNINASTARINNSLSMTLTVASSYDFTVRIASPQMELGAFSTTWIPTTNAAATRVADSSRTTGRSSLIGQSEGTLFLDLYYLPLQNQGRAMSITETSSPLTNRLIININNTNNRVSVISRQSGSSTNGSMSETASTVLLNGRNKIALGYKSGDSVLYINGVSVATNTDSFTFSATLNDIFLMTSEISLVADNVGFVNISALFTTRLTNAQLTALTTL